MRHTLPIAPQFYVTAPQPCPYLEGRLERKLFTALQGEHAQRLNDSLSKQGFRRSQNVLYRPSCAECSACLSARIRVADFRPSRTHRKILKAAAHLRRNATSPWATEDQFALFRRYLDARHADGGMADMDVFEFAAMIEETPIKSRVIEYTRPAATGERGRPLACVSLTDVFDDGLSMVYSFYDPDLADLSLGTFAILDHIEIAREAGLPYVYLGYWVPGSRKMGYKAKFSALEIYKGGAWVPIGDPADHSAELHPLSVEPIAEQVARIALPEARQAEARQGDARQADTRQAGPRAEGPQPDPRQTDPRQVEPGQVEPGQVEAPQTGSGPAGARPAEARSTEARSIEARSTEARLPETPLPRPHQT